MGGEDAAVKPSDALFLDRQPGTQAEPGESCSITQAVARRGARQSSPWRTSSSCVVLSLSCLSLSTCEIRETQQDEHRARKRRPSAVHGWTGRPREILTAVSRDETNRCAPPCGGYLPQRCISHGSPADVGRRRLFCEEGRRTPCYCAIDTCRSGCGERRFRTSTSLSSCCTASWTAFSSTLEETEKEASVRGPPAGCSAVNGEAGWGGASCDAAFDAFAGCAEV